MVEYITLGPLSADEYKLNAPHLELKTIVPFDCTFGLV